MWLPGQAHQIRQDQMISFLVENDYDTDAFLQDVYGYQYERIGDDSNLYFTEVLDSTILEPFIKQAFSMSRA